MKRVIIRTVVLTLTLMVSDFGIAQDFRNSQTETGGARSRVANTQDDPIALGHPLSYWLKSIRARDPINAEQAFDAIVALGPAARAAIPDLTQIVAEPFEPIRIGRDSREEILAKVRNIDFRASAVDSLGAIGEAAANSAEPVIRWGLTVRIAGPVEHSRSTDAVLIELVGIDVLERMRAAGAVARFGPDASDAVQNLIESADNEKRKFAAAVLNEQTILVASQLMQQEDCRDRMRGLSLLSAMWPVVDRKHLEMLNETFKCSDEDIGEPFPAFKRGAALSSYRP